MIIMKSPVLLPQCPGVSGSLEGKKPVGQEQQRREGPEEERTHCEKSLMKGDTGMSHWRILTSECEPDPLHSAFHWNCTFGHFNHLLLWYMNIWHLYQKDFKSDMTQDANCQTAERIRLQKARIQHFYSRCMSVQWFSLPAFISLFSSVYIWAAAAFYLGIAKKSVWSYEGLKMNYLWE